MAGRLRMTGYIGSRYRAAAPGSALLVTVQRGRTPLRARPGEALMSTVRRAVTRITASFRTRGALGLRPVTAPVMVFIPLGILLGPAGVDIISAAALGHLDVVISVALATLGVFIGIAAGTQSGSVRRLMTASTVEAAITILAVAGATYVLLSAWQMPLGMSYALVALTLGVCASASAAPSVEEHDNTARRVAARVADLDDVLPIVLGGIVLSLLGGSDRAAVMDVGLSIGIGLGVAASGLLLFELECWSAERDVFVLGTLALLGGAAAYLDLSPLLAGLAAGWLWAQRSWANRAGGRDAPAQGPAPAGGDPARDRRCQSRAVDGRDLAVRAVRGLQDGRQAHRRLDGVAARAGRRAVRPRRLPDPARRDRNRVRAQRAAGRARRRDAARVRGLGGCGGERAARRHRDSRCRFLSERRRPDAQADRSRAHHRARLVHRRGHRHHPGITTGDRPGARILPDRCRTLGRAARAIRPAARDRLPGVRHGLRALRPATSSRGRWRASSS